MNKIDTTCEHSKIRLIAAAQAFQGCTRTDGTETRIPGTGKRILIGDDAYLAMVALPAAKGGITSLEGLTRYGWDEDGMAVDNAFGHYFKKVDVERLLVTQAQAAAPATDEPVAWMNPETLDVIHDSRKRAWLSDFGMGGKAKATGYTQPLYAHPAAAVEPAVEQAEPESTHKNLLMWATNVRSVFTCAETSEALRQQALQGLFNAVDEATCTLAAPAAPEQVQANAALRKLCDQLDGMKRRLLHTPGTGQHHSYLIHEDVEAYVEEARKSLAAPSAAQVQAIPAGYKLVPIEPTVEIRNACYEEYHKAGATYTSMCRAIIAAAPSAAAPAAPEQDEVRDQALEEAANLVIKFTAVPRDVLGPATTQMKSKAAMGERIADAIRAMNTAGSPTATAAARDVLAERRRQVEIEGWTAERDDKYTNCELARAAATYATCSHIEQLKLCGEQAWPWHPDWWKRSTYRRDLTKAGALILAEIERIDRDSMKTTTNERDA